MTLINFPSVAIKYLRGSFRSITLEVFSEKGGLKKFAKVTGKHLCCSLFFNKIVDLSLQLYQKRNSGAGAFL